MSFLMAVIAFDLGHVFVILFLLVNDIDTCGKGVGVMTLSSPSSAAAETSLVVLILLRVGRRSLLSGKQLFSTRCVSREGVGRLILSTGVFLLFLSGLILSKTPLVHVASSRRELENRLCLYVDGFLHDLFLGVQISALGIYLSPNGRFQAFQEASDHDPLIWSCTGIKLLENRL